MASNIIHPAKRALLIEQWSKALNKILELLEIKPRHYNKTINGYRSVIHALKNEPYVHLRKEFFERNDLVDSVREESLYSVYSELKDLLSD